MQSANLPGPRLEVEVSRLDIDVCLALYCPKRTEFPEICDQDTVAWRLPVHVTVRLTENSLRFFHSNGKRPIFRSNWLSPLDLKVVDTSLQLFSSLYALKDRNYHPLSVDTMTVE